MLQVSQTRDGMRLITLAAFLSLAGMIFAAPDRADEKAREDAVKKAVDDFKEKMKSTRAPEQKAQLILDLGAFEHKDTAIASALSRYLKPSGRDINYIVPVVTAQALGNFRGNLRASVSLMSVLPLYKQIPYVRSKIIAAIGKVGHRSALSLFDRDLKGKNSKAAINAVRAIGDFPGHVAMPVLFNEYKRLEGKRAGAQNQQKTFIDAVLPVILKEIKDLSGAGYPTIMEMQIWWKRRGQKYLEKAKKEEEARLAAKPDPNAPKPVLPPIMIFEFNFNENRGNDTKNVGASSAHYPKATFTDPAPAWSGNKPTAGGAAAVNFGKSGSTKAIEVPGQILHLMTLKSFTITGWISLQDEPATDEGVPIVSWLFPKRDGVELLYQKGGILRLGINERAKGTPAKSAEKQIPDLDEASTDTNKQRNNWRFFAISYDSGLASGHVKFYFGGSRAAKLVSTVDYDRGPVGKKVAPCLTIGNVVNLERRMFRDRSFSGLIDEIKIFGSTANGSGALTLAQIKEAQDLPVTN